MKFLTKINRQYFWTLSILLILISIIGYFVLKYILNDELKEDIFEKEYAIIDEIKKTGNLPNIYPIIETSRISGNKIKARYYKEVYLTDEAEGEEECYLEYTNTIEVNNQYYLIKLRHSLLETNDLIIAIALPLLVLLILAFSVSYFTTRKLNKTIWKDFENNLKEIEDFSFKMLKSISLKETQIEEFDRLNNTVMSMVERLKNDYLSLKQFTENASHEIQTPISIILVNLEEILQQDLQEETFKQIVTSINALKRLSTLNKSLLLLTKIDNQQYKASKLLNINNIIKEKIKDFTPLIDKKNIQLEIISSDIFSLNINSELIDILLNNLISNAINHNIKNGRIEIEITNTQIKVCNTAENNSLTNDTIFERFTKENSNSFGLGLAIVKQICDNNKLNIVYNKSNLHCLLITKT